MTLKTLALGAVCAALLTAPAQAAVFVNPSFETGDLTGWSGGGLVQVVAEASDLFASVTYTATEGDSFAELTAGSEAGAYTLLTQAFTLNFTGRVSFDAAFLSFDVPEFNDDAYVRVYGSGLDTVLFAADVVTVGDGGFTPWARFTSDLLGPGEYVFEAGVRNLDDADPAYSSKLLIDNVAIAVPEPAAWAMMLVGFGGLGAALRRRRAILAIA